MWKLWLDDMREPDGPGFVVCRFSDEAMAEVCRRGPPRFMALDFNLGHSDNVLVFLRWLREHPASSGQAIPDYSVHSSDPWGRRQVDAFMAEWTGSRH
jgi:hypothetical protein